MKKEAIWPKEGPEPKGPYSPAIVYGNMVFVSGQGPVDPKTGEVKHGDVLDEFKLAVENIKIILEEAGSSLSNVLKITLYLDDMKDFSKVDERYKDYFGSVFPARTTIQAGKLPLGIKIEIDVIAYTGT